MFWPEEKKKSSILTSGLTRCDLPYNDYCNQFVVLEHLDDTPPPPANTVSFGPLQVSLLSCLLNDTFVPDTMFYV